MNSLIVDGAAPIADADAYRDIVQSYHDRGVTDGVTVLPVTAARLERMVAGSGRASSDVLGHGADGRDVTVKDLAVQAVMAGCQSAYMPLLVTVTEILLSPAFPTQLLWKSVGSFFPLIIINGPAREILGLNSRFNAFGPGFRANATIGRAVGLVVRNLIAKGPDRSALGTHFKFATVIAEDEENNIWEPFHTDLGFSKSDSTVFVGAAWHSGQVGQLLSSNPQHLLRTYADDIARSGRFAPLDVDIDPASYDPRAVLVLGEDHRRYFGDPGLTKQDVQAGLYEMSGRRAAEIRAAGYGAHPALAGAGDDDIVRIHRKPDDFLILGAGSGGGRGMVMGVMHSQIRSFDPAPSVEAVPGDPVSPSTVEAVAATSEAYVEKGMTDGWPVIVPDKALLAAFVAASGRDAGDLIGTAPWRSEPVKVSDIAMNAIMAGCAAEHMPLVITIAELLFASEPGLGFAASIGGFWPIFIIHGPAVDTYGVNSGGSLCGPGSPVNVALGRMVRLSLINAGGYRPGVLDRSAVGSPFKYGAVIAEDSSSSPWEPLHTSWGLPAEVSGVSMYWTCDARFTMHNSARSPVELLMPVCDEMAALHFFDSPSPRTASQTIAMQHSNKAIVVLSRDHSAILREAGWSRTQVQEFIYTHSARLGADIRASGYDTSPMVSEDFTDSDSIPVSASPDRIVVLTAGGEGGVTMSLRTIADPLDRPWFRPIVDRLTGSDNEYLGGISQDPHVSAVPAAGE